MLLGIVLAVIIAVPSMSMADKESLRGIQAVTVNVQESGEYGKPNTMLEKQIRTDVELRLRMATIKVIPDQEWTGDRQGDLDVTIKWIEANYKNGSPTGEYVFSISITLYMYVYAVWDTLMIPRYVGAWDTQFYGNAGASEFNENTRKLVKDLLDMFINDYLAVNTKEEDKEP